MENYNKLLNIVSSFRIGVVQHEGTAYYILLDNNIDKAFNKEWKTIKESVFNELLDLEPSVANKRLSYLSGKLDVLAKYQENTNNLKDAYRSFNTICNQYNIDVCLEHSKNLIIAELNGNFIVTLHFCKQLDREIWVRKNIIHDLKMTFEQSIQGEFLNNYNNNWSYTNITNLPLEPGELEFKEWIKICDSFIEAATQTVNHNTLNSSGKNSKYILDFEKDILNEKGQSIFKSLKTKYHKNQPQNIVFMLYALEAKKCLQHNVDDITGTNWQLALKTHFGRTYDRKSLEFSLKNYAGTSIDTRRNPDFDIEVKKIELLLSNLA